MNRDASKSGAEAHMVISAVSKQAMSLPAPHQDAGNCPAPVLDTSWGEVGGRSTDNFSMKTRQLWEAKESKNGPNSWRSNMCSFLHHLFCLCIAQPRRDATGRWHRLTKSSWIPSLHLWSRSHHSVGQGDLQLMCLSTAAQEQQSCKVSANTHTASPRISPCATAQHPLFPALHRCGWLSQK